MDKFICSPEDVRFILYSKNIQATQNVKCLTANCKRTWKEHFAGESTTIPIGACPKDWESIYNIPKTHTTSVQGRSTCWCDDCQNPGI